MLPALSMATKLFHFITFFTVSSYLFTLGNYFDCYHTESNLYQITASDLSLALCWNFTWNKIASSQNANKKIFFFQNHIKRVREANSLFPCPIIRLQVKCIFVLALFQFFVLLSFQASQQLTTLSHTYQQCPPPKISNRRCLKKAEPLLQSSWL